MQQHQYAQQIIQTISAWEGIETFLQRFGGIEFKLGEAEIGRLHMGSGQVDVYFPRRVRVALIAAGEAEAHPVQPESGWVTHRTRGEGDAEQAIRLCRLAYLHRRYTHSADRAAFAQAAAELGFCASVIESFKRPHDGAEAKVE